MSEPVILRDPTAETASLLRPRRTPPPSLDGLTIGLLDIGKTRSDEFVDNLARLLDARGLATRRYDKPTNTRVAPVATLQRMAAECDVAVIALSD